MPTLDEIEIKQINLKNSIEELLEQSQGEITEDIEELLEASLEAEHELSKKFDDYAYVMDKIEKEALSLQQRIESLQKRMNVKQKMVQHMRDRLLQFMLRNQVTKVEGDFRFSVQKNGGREPIIIDESIPISDLPSEYIKTNVTHTYNRDAIYNALKQGVELDFARIGVRGVHLRID